MEHPYKISQLQIYIWYSGFLRWRIQCNISKKSPGEENSRVEIVGPDILGSMTPKYAGLIQMI